MPVPFPAMESVFRGALRWGFPRLGLLLLLLVGSCVEDIDLTDVELPVRVRVDFVADPEPELSVTARDLPLHWVRLGITDADTGGGVATGDIELDPDSVPDRWRLHLDVPSSWQTTLVGTLELIRILEGEVGEEERVEWAVEVEPTPVTAEQESWEVLLPLGRGGLEELSVTQVQVSEPEGPVLEGEAFTLAASTEGGPEEGARIFWGSEDPEVAEVDESGLVIALLPGETRIIAASGQQWAAAEVQVLQRVSSVIVEPPAATATALGEEVAFTALPLDPRGAPVTDRELAVEWGVEDTGVAEHLGNGVFQAIGRGTTEVFAVVEGVEGRATLTVDVAAEGVFEGSLVVFDEQDLAEFAESGWVEVTGSLTIGGEESPLTTLSGLESLRRVGGAVRIRDNPSLGDVSGLAGLEEVGRWFDVRFNESLTELPPLPELRFVGADSATQVSLTIVQNPALARIGGFPALEEAEGNLSISFNPVLADLAEFSSLRSLGGDLRVRGNSSLASFGGFPVLEAVGGSLFVLDNEALENLDAFSGLTSTIQDLHVHNNASLTSVQGLQNIGSATEAFPAVLGDFTVTDNPELPTSQAEDLAETLGVGGTVTISGNLEDEAEPALIQWTAGGGGDWHEAGNWALGRVPIEGDEVEITLEGTYTVTLGSEPVTVARLHLGGETGEVTLSLGQSELTVTDLLTVGPAAELQVLGEATISASMAENAGSFLIPGELFYLASGPEPLFTNTGGGSFGPAAEGVAQLTLEDGAFLNEGTLTTGGSGGTLWFQNGTVTLAEGTSLDGDGLLALSGGTLNLAEPVVLEGLELFLQEMVLNGPGSVSLPEGSGHSWIDVTANTLVENRSELTLSGVNVMNQGFINAPGAYVTVFGLTGPTENSLTIVESDGFYNEGHVSLFDPYSGQDRVLRLSVPEGTFVIEEGASLEVPESTGTTVAEVVAEVVNRGAVAVESAAAFGGEGSLVNEGSIRLNAGEEVLHIQASLIHTGELEVASGTLSLAGGGEWSGQATLSAEGRVAIEGSFDNDEMLLMDGVQFQGAGVVQLVSGELNVEVGGTVTVSRFAQSGGLFRRGNMTITDEWIWEGGLTTLGTTLLGEEGEGYFRGAQVKQTGGRTIENRGTITWSDAGDLVWNGGSIFTNAPGAIFDIATDADMLQTIENTRSSFINQGTVRKSEPGITDFSARLENQGTLSLAAGALRPDTTFQQSASGVLTGRGTLDLATTVEVLPLQGDLVPGLPVGILTVEGDLPLDVGVQATFVLGGTETGEFGRLVITGNVVPNGTLEVLLAEGYEPVEGDSFPIISAAAFVDSQFQAIDLPELSEGLEWRIEETGTDFILHVVVL